MQIARALLIVLALAASAEASAQTGVLNCDSISYRRQFCPANTQGRVVLIRENSTGNLCRQGRGWGFDDRGIWVDRGCRGQFSFGRGGSGGGGNWGRRGEITCESQGYRHRFCNADTRGRVSLVRELSTGNLCRQGRGWGFDNNGIWVDRGCRGVFRYGRDGGGSGGSSGSGRNDGAAIAAGILGAMAVGAAIGSSQQQAAPPPPPPPPPLPPSSAARPPSWAIGSFQAFDPDSGDIVQLVVDGGGRVFLRNEVGDVVNQGNLRDGTITWSDGKRSWLVREEPGVLMGDIDTGRHFFFRRNA